MIKKTLITLLISLFAAMAIAGCSVVEAGKSGNSESMPVIDEQAELTVAIKTINKYGNVILDTTFDEMNTFGIAPGDIIKVYFLESEYEIPVGTAFSDVDSGDMVCRFDYEDYDVVLGINYGSFAASTGLAVKQTIEEAPGYKWDMNATEVVMAMKEKGGYLSEYNARNLTRTNNREDYPLLSDEEFANFRAVDVTGLKSNLIYRGSSPLETDIGRNEYAMAAVQKAGIRAVINLNDSVETMYGYETFAGSYYADCAVFNPEMGYDFLSEEFSVKFKQCVEFIIENDGPYFIHCKEGKDRTGVICAILECFAGATAEEIKNDYMLTYYNFFGVKQGDAVYDVILNKNLVKTLEAVLGVKDMDAVNLKAAATEYLSSIGITGEQLSALGEKLIEG